MYSRSPTRYAPLPRLDSVRHATIGRADVAVAVSRPAAPYAARPAGSRRRALVRSESTPAMAWPPATARADTLTITPSMTGVAPTSIAKSGRIGSRVATISWDANERPASRASDRSRPRPSAATRDVAAGAVAAGAT